MRRTITNLFRRARDIGSIQNQPKVREREKEVEESETEQDDTAISYSPFKQEHIICLCKLIDGEQARLLASEKALLHIQQQISLYDRSPAKHTTNTNTQQTMLILMRSAMGFKAMREKSKMIISRLQDFLVELEECAYDVNNGFEERVQTIVHAPVL
jgi:hypothetical protein